MKKMKSFLCVAILLIGLAGNVFAFGAFDSVFTNFFGNIVNALFSQSKDSDDCPTRTCSDCKVTEPNCRPGGGGGR